MKNKKEVLKKLENVISKEESKWHEESNFRAINEKWLRRSQAVALKVLRALREKSISQKELAKRLTVSPQLVNKWVKGKTNFTFETIAKLELALDIKLMDIEGTENASR